MERITRLFPMAVIGMFVALLVGCASTDSRSSTGEYIDDTVITTKVKTAVLGESSLSSFDVSVETYQGVVQLSGFVDSESDIEKAEELTREVEGVKSVSNDLELKNP